MKMAKIALLAAVVASGTALGAIDNAAASPLSVALAASIDTNAVNALSNALDAATKTRFTRASRSGMEIEYRVYPNMMGCRAMFHTREIVTGRRGVRETERRGPFEVATITRLNVGIGGTFGEAHLSIFIGPQADGKPPITIEETPYNSNQKQVSQGNQIDLFFPSPDQADAAKEMLTRLAETCRTG